MFGSSAHIKENQLRFRCMPLKRWQTQTQGILKRVEPHPEQGSFCSQVISRKGSQPPSEAEYLRAVNQRWVQKIVKSDQHQHRKDARRQRRDAVHL